MTTDIETLIAAARNRVEAQEFVAEPLIQRSLATGRRRRRRRQVGKGLGVLGGAGVLTLGSLMAIDHSGRSSSTHLNVTASISPTPQAVVTLDGVTVAYIPDGYAAAGAPQTYQPLACMRFTNAVFESPEVSPGHAPAMFAISVSRSTAILPRVNVPSDMDQVQTEPYTGMHGESGTLSHISHTLAPNVVVSVRGSDISPETLRRVLASITNGPQDDKITPSIVPSPSNPPGLPEDALAHC